MSTILFIEDALEYRVQTKRMLEAQGFVVIEANTAEQGKAIASEDRNLQLILLDLGLPDNPQRDTRIIEEINIIVEQQIPIIVLTVVPSDRLLEETFSRGASDYVEKTRMESELLPRIRASIRRSNKTSNHATTYRCGDFTYTFSSEDAVKEDKKLILTAKEQDALKLLIENADSLVTHEELFRAVYHRGPYQDETGRVRPRINTLIHSLRDKIDQNRRLALITLEYGFGYRMKASETSSSSQEE